MPPGLSGADDRFVFEQPLVDRAELLHRKIAEIDAHAPPVLVGARKTIEQRREIRIGKDGAVEQILSPASRRRTGRRCMAARRAYRRPHRW